MGREAGNLASAHEPQDVKVETEAVNVDPPVVSVRSEDVKRSVPELDPEDVTSTDREWVVSAEMSKTSAQQLLSCSDTIGESSEDAIN